MKKAYITAARCAGEIWAESAPQGAEKGNPETRSADYQADDQRGRESLAAESAISAAPRAERYRAGSGADPGGPAPVGEMGDGTDPTQSKTRLVRVTSW